mgnify:FL=1
MENQTPIDQEIQNFQPKCLGPEGRNLGRSIAVSATGFVLPCCWLDRPSSPMDEKVKTLFDKSLHIDNNDTIEDIISAEPWQKFMRELIEKPEESSSICLEMCTGNGNRYVKKLNKS